MKAKMNVNVNWEAVLNKGCKAGALVAGAFTGCAITNLIGKPKTVFGMVVDCVVSGIIGAVCASGYALMLDKAWGTNCLFYDGKILEWEVETEIENMDGEAITY